MAKQIPRLSDRHMPVDQQALIPPRIEPESQKGSLPERQKARTEALVGLNFKVPASFRREFRKYCAAQDLSLVDALAAAFEALKEKDSNHGK
jgi:hypothetical protein